MTFSINPTANKTQAQFQQLAIAQNGTGTTAVIAGGVATSTVATPASVATSSGTMVSGSGTFAVGGACVCSALCGVASFPNPAVQGLAAFGGFAGIKLISLLPQVNFLTHS